MLRVWRCAPEGVEHAVVQDVAVGLFAQGAPVVRVAPAPALVRWDGMLPLLLCPFPYATVAEAVEARAAHVSLVLQCHSAQAYRALGHRDSQ